MKGRAGHWFLVLLLQVIVTSCTSISRIGHNYSFAGLEPNKKEAILLFYNEFEPDFEYMYFSILLENKDTMQQEFIKGVTGFVFSPEKRPWYECMAVSLPPAQWDMYAHSVRNRGTVISQSGFQHHLFDLDDRQVGWLGTVYTRDGLLQIKHDGIQKRECLEKLAVQFPHLELDRVEDIPFTFE